MPLPFSLLTVTQKNIDLLEAVQRQSVQFNLFFNNYLPNASVSEMLILILSKKEKYESKLIVLFYKT